MPVSTRRLASLRRSGLEAPGTSYSSSQLVTPSPMKRSYQTSETNTLTRSKYFLHSKDDESSSSDDDSFAAAERDDSFAAAVRVSPLNKRVKTNDSEEAKIISAVSPSTESSASSESVTATLSGDQKPSSRKKKKKTRNSALPIKQRDPPSGWQDIYSLVEELRQDRTSPCDESGCEALPDRSCSPKEFRFHVLVSLMLSSQTKDSAVGDAVRGMQRDGVLNVHSISHMSTEKLNGYISRVGFHNNKTKYLKQVVEILKTDFDGDIPPTAEAMMELPGVGPKMAYICENVAWNKQSGIGVDTHMHRLFNALGWVQSKTPEQTRVQLEAWLPRDRWADVNLLWVGFGQEVQQYKLKVLRKALTCSRPADALKLLKRCGLDYAKEGRKHKMEEEITKALKG